ncbi:MAG: NAD(P)-dependent alcohol dehydrogenase, partial [Gemmataceae bacterium]|nr:NAD(P)-dependent alcohol dehydrogenase [Gemmataceae bacterium]
VRAASLNFRDLLLVKGQYNPKLALPRVVGSDGAGEVVAVGAGVTRFRVGDRVANTFMPLWDDGPITDAAAKATYGSDLDGVFAEVVAVGERAAVHIPDHLTFEEAATLPCAAVTAWNALTAAGVGPGTTVLLQGTGGVSLFALQLATALGAKALITSGSDEKLARALDLGAAAGVNYRTNPDWDRWAREQTGKAGVGVVVEVGGAGTLERSLRAAKTGGHVALIGVLSGAGAVNPMLVLMKAIRLQGVFVGSRAMFEDMNRLLAEKGIKPVLDRVFPLAEAIEAFRHLESGAHFGKVVLRV